MQQHYIKKSLQEIFDFIRLRLSSTENIKKHNQLLGAQNKTFNTITPPRNPKQNI